ncbi:unnamed protein product [Eruca vesicaria subsp. sativa]|uniref:TF-B3 domain-containing protein n=1 Tax=Eruca vesicaria subsp. sativa TaxID=29727 RepID=A0ABC8JDL9_ERUVS|nr:unnamed protein product [Eruca vesicaria subsp. sativa]
MQTKGSGDSSDDRLPKFFRVYLPNDSGDDLDIPVSFNRYLPTSVPKNLTVRSINGKVWNLKLKKRRGDPEKFSMVDGWKRIVKDEDLKGGEFLAFEFDGSCLFDFCIYGQTTCKRLGKPTEVEDEDDDDVIVLDEDDDDDEDYDGVDDEAAEDDVDVEANDEEVDAEDEDDDVDDGMEDDDDHHRQLLDDPDNPSFTVILNPKKMSQLLIPSHVMKDYNLNFTDRITIIDPLVPKFGTLERKIKYQDNGSVFIKGFGSVFRRNNMKTTDKMICEVKKNANDVANILKVYIVRG